ncbi:hypothetical protein HYPSUDRAFT_202753 [Hypholoma sublateritium FD-334 SS-4]|uniref:Uncharacterized protein n=1 Tax=Hypholoma sublateritium (strain FD-334 SS-4) TaxID=945553 RepID=A0A0D2MDN2_HYPSF|nr:hypothetical protein HYPSUDRAFT_202753 [Hypholoma sublateritium FD-334 SS-4]
MRNGTAIETPHRRSNPDVRDQREMHTRTLRSKLARTVVPVQPLEPTGMVPAPEEPFVLVRRKQSTGAYGRWQVAQIVFSVALPPLFDSDGRFGRIPCRLFVEETGMIAEHPSYFCEDTGEIMRLPDRPQMHVAQRRILSLDFCCVVYRGGRGSHPAMYIKEVSATESEVMLLDEHNQSARRHTRVSRTFLVPWEPPAEGCTCSHPCKLQLTALLKIPSGDSSIHSPIKLLSMRINTHAARESTKLINSRAPRRSPTLADASRTRRTDALRTFHAVHKSFHAPVPTNISAMRILQRALSNESPIRLGLCDTHHLVPVPAEQFVIVRRKQASDSGSRWQVAQINPTNELPLLFDNNGPFARVPCQLFLEQTGMAAGDHCYFSEETGEIKCLPAEPQMHVTRRRNISSLDFVWVVYRHPGRADASIYRPAMFIRDVSDTECQVMLLEEDNEHLRRRILVPRENIVLSDPPSEYRP